jgi:hypothetical protein
MLVVGGASCVGAGACCVTVTVGAGAASEEHATSPNDAIAIDDAIIIFFIIYPLLFTSTSQASG